MKEIALHIIDIVENSVKAGATQIDIEVLESVNQNVVNFVVRDNGSGMDSELIEKVKSPFYSSRKERKIGMGIPLLIQNCEMSGGEVNITGKPGVGTVLSAWFVFDNIDRPPMGNIADGMVNLIISATDAVFTLKYSTDIGDFEFKTTDITAIFGNISIQNPQVAVAIKEYLSENIDAIRSKYDSPYKTMFV